jgi:hypothetical protein
MASAFGPQFDTSDFGMQISHNDYQEREKTKRKAAKEEFDKVMERTKNGTATKEELKKYCIHPMVESKTDSRGYRIIPKDGIYFPTVSKEIYDKYNSDKDKPSFLERIFGRKNK